MRNVSWYIISVNTHNRVCIKLKSYFYIKKNHDVEKEKRQSGHDLQRETQFARQDEWNK